TVDPGLVLLKHAIPSSTDESTMMERGAYLVKLGDCVACHTQQGGTPVAGGRPLENPFVTVLSANLTPDNNTGIGRYTP
ncbi:MAG: cytochrome c, partial [Burkholderiaceae bacterium]|nr:cytochrome c [Burkholderiaceae bacterium]